jgi:multicomponent Na+:H+ antiporter subunit G
MTAEIIRWVTGACVVLGLLTTTLAVFGILRFRDIYRRVHAAGNAVFLGVMPILLAIAIRGEPEMTARAVLIGVFLLLTAPVSSHAIARGAYLTNESGHSPEPSAPEGESAADRQNLA